MNNESLNDLDQFETWVKELKKEDFKVLANKYLVDTELKQFVLNPEK
jgi:predicted Zn-dependent peptidase